MNLYEEFRGLVVALNAADVDYALCGGLAMAVYQSPRATLDVDLLVKLDDLAVIKACASNLGFCIDTGFLKTKDDKVAIYRMVKPGSEDEEPVVLDLVVVNDDLKEVWDDRQKLPWGNDGLYVVSKGGLVAMKKLRGNGRDLDDIAFLQDLNEG